MEADHHQIFPTASLRPWTLVNLRAHAYYFSCGSCVPIARIDRREWNPQRIAGIIVVLTCTLSRHLKWGLWKLRVLLQVLRRKQYYLCARATDTDVSIGAHFLGNKGHVFVIKAPWMSDGRIWDENGDCQSEIMSSKHVLVNSTLYLYQLLLLIGSHLHIVLALCG